MPPRQANRTSVPAIPPATTENLPQTTQVRRSGRSRHAPPGGECFDLANISGDEEEEEDQHPTQAAAQPPISTDSTETTIPEISSGINNPDIVVTRDSKNQAEDVAFFYNKFPKGYECKFCRWVFPHYKLPVRIYILLTEPPTTQTPTNGMSRSTTYFHRSHPRQRFDLILRSTICQFTW